MLFLKANSKILILGVGTWGKQNIRVPMGFGGGVLKTQKRALRLWEVLENSEQNYLREVRTQKKVSARHYCNRVLRTRTKSTCDLEGA
jgi:hypothetical protein